MKRLVPCLLVAACTTPMTPVDEGDVQVVAQGGGTVHASACLDASLFHCSQTTDHLELDHDGLLTAMPYFGLLAPEFQADAAIGDPTTMYAIQSPDGTARIQLPADLELAGMPDHAVQRDDGFHLSWPAGGSPMMWTFSYTCGAVFGEGAEEPLSDEGGMDIDMASIDNQITHDSGATGPCTVTVQVDRVELGALDSGFPARGASGIERRTFQLELVR